MIDSLKADLHFASRMLRKSPIFTVVAVGCIAIGSGAVATIFSAMNALMLRPLSGTSDASRLVRIERKKPGSADGISASYPYYEYLRDRTRTLDGLVTWGKASLSLRPSGAQMGTGIYGSFVSGNFFSVFGVRPRLGRFFLPEEDRTEGTHPVIVVSEGFWRAHLGGDSTAIGRDMRVNGKVFTLVGVAPVEFEGPDAPLQTDAWVPLRSRSLLVPNAGTLGDPDRTWLRLAGRLEPGVSRETAGRELSALTAALRSDVVEQPWMNAYTDTRLTQLMGLPPDATSWLGSFLGMLLGAATLVLLIASVNVASMLSARAMARRREMAVRAALGAGRGRLVRQLLTEILLLFALGALGGMVLAYGATAALERLPVQSELQFSLQLSPDLAVFALALALALVTGVVVGLAPALRTARSDVASRLREGAGGATGRRTRTASALVVGQLALSLVLLVGAGLFVRALQRGNTIEPGFDATGVTTAQLNADSWGYDETKQRVFFPALRERIAAIPGVAAVSYTTILPLTLRSSGDNVRVDGFGGGDEVAVNQLQVDADYFSVLRIPLLAGRPIGREDRQQAPKVAVVNETFAKRFWKDGDALGRTFHYADQVVTIVGVARDAKYASLNESTPPLAYFPVAQQWRPLQVLIVRASGDLGALGPRIQDAMRTIDASLSRPRVMTLTDAMSFGLLPQRVAAMVTGVLGGTGLFLAVVGLYGVVAYSVSRRTREIGVRLALGAREADVLTMILREGMRVAVIGVAIGLLLAGGAARVIASFLFGVSPFDALTFGGTATLLAAIALFATWLPARRAASVNPMVVLRGE